MEEILIKQGAEARIYTSIFEGKPCIIKERFPKSYRHPELDAKLTSRRMTAEIRSLRRCRDHGIPTPTVYFVDSDKYRIYMEHLTECVTLKEFIESSAGNEEILGPTMDSVGRLLGLMHSKDIIHGDLTTSNLMRKPDGVIVVIDLGLASTSSAVEERAVDLYVLERAFASTHPNAVSLFAGILLTYESSFKQGPAVIKKLNDVRARGRKKSMLG